MMVRCNTMQRIGISRRSYQLRSLLRRSLRDSPHRYTKMNESETGISLGELILLLVYLATLVHVFLESKRMNDFPIRNTLLVAVCVWPLGYAFWIFYWPGTFWRKLTGRKKLEPTLPLRFDREGKTKVYPDATGQRR